MKPLLQRWGPSSGANLTAIASAMRALLLVLVISIGGCGSDSKTDSRASGLSRDLTRAGADTAPIRSPLTAQQQDQLEKCKFVYHDAQGLRECLVLRNGWTTQDAAREIAIYEAAIARVRDSLEMYVDSVAAAGRRVRDSIYAAQSRKEESLRLGRLRAAQHREDSLYMIRDLLDGPITPTHPDSGAWMGDDRSGAYYRATCEAAKRIPADHRIYFGAENHAESAHFWHSRQPGC